MSGKEAPAASHSVKKCEVGSKPDLARYYFCLSECQRG
jgi:hypothetical protein